MKNKTKIVAIATSIASAIALVGGTLVMPVLAADDFSKETAYFEIEIDECSICGEWYTVYMDGVEFECPNKANHPGEQTTETENSIMPLADDFSKEDTGFEVEIFDTCEICGTEYEPGTECPNKANHPSETETPTEPEKPAEPVETIDVREGVNEFAKEIVEITIELPDDYEDKTEVTVPDNSAEIAKLEAEAVEARQAADVARAEADRLEAIALEKEAALEAARQ